MGCIFHVYCIISDLVDKYQVKEEDVTYVTTLLRQT